MNHFQFNSYNPKIDSIQSVISQMQSLEEELQDSDLQNLRYFNTTYLIITQNVSSKFHTNYFQNDTAMNSFDICFAKYYFEALNSFVKSQNSDPAWQILFESCKKNNLLKTQYLSLGVNAHVNNDLAFSIEDSKANPVPESDYQKINHIITSSLHQVFKSYKEVGPLNSLKNISLPIIKPVLSNIIKNWRDKAWHNSISLANGTKSRDHVKKEALHIAKTITIYV
jgi:hypothetical protein